MNTKPTISIYIFEDGTLPWNELCATVETVNRDQGRPFVYTLHESGKNSIEGATSYNQKRELIRSVKEELAIFVFDLDYRDKLASSDVALEHFNRLSSDYQSLLAWEKYGIELIGNVILQEACAGLIAIASNLAVNEKFNAIVTSFESHSVNRLHWHNEQGSLTGRKESAPEKLRNVIAKFESIRGESRHRLLPWSARSWFSENNPNPEFMRHNWKDVPDCDREKAIGELTNYFCGVSNEIPKNVRDWLNNVARVEGQMAALWENLKTLVGACSKAHNSTGNRFLSFPALAFVLTACCKRNGFAVLKQGEFPDGLQLWKKINFDDAQALLSNLIGCLFNLANGDGVHRTVADEPLVISCQTSASSFDAEFDIPFAAIGAKLKELEKNGGFRSGGSGSCAPLARLKDAINGSPSANLKVAASAKGKTVLTIEFKKKGKRG